MNIEQGRLISYAMSFSSFLLSEVKVWRESLVYRIILFGSVARGDFDKHSDVDIFIDTKKADELKKIIDPIKERFYNSSATDTWRLLDVNREISLKIGDLDEWTSLRRSIIADGITLYGRFEEIPAKLLPYMLFYFEPIKNSMNRVRIARNLFGYTIRNKRILGILDKFKGERLGERQFLIPFNKSDDVVHLLNKEKIKYKLKEVWV